MKTYGQCVGGRRTTGAHTDFAPQGRVFGARADGTRYAGIRGHSFA